ncbi:scavenger receptor class F member 2-like isoform X2 [Mya arenaria]|uniref:scavenger receptor class F member 2-like isoform X2 n=1 Tax=Mya arenaria TaxID=6604 RepID=UPI0022E36551|nr:scavenger receptor class F member 2-like isoform X2 [Mya arenaria]
MYGKCLECNDGFYPNGNGSCMSCSSNCKNGQCNTETGACINGCTDRFWGDKCDIPCDPNCDTCQLDSGICLSCKNTTYHGLSCSESCSTSCLESKCEQNTGYCSIGCSRDSFGNMCDIKCPSNCQQGDSKTSCNIDGDCLYGCINDLGGRDCSERRIYIGSPTNVATAALSGVFGILLICTAAGCYLWNRRRSSPTVSEQENQRETVMTYEQLQRQANEPTYKNVDENYSVLST